MSQLSSRKRLLFLLIIFLLILIIITVSPWFTYQANIREWKPAVVTHTIPVDSEFKKIWDLTAYIRCTSCLISTENNVYFSGSLKNNSPEFLVSLDLLTGQIEWQQMLRKKQFLNKIDSRYIYVNQAATQRITSATQTWGTAEIILWVRPFAKQ